MLKTLKSLTTKKGWIDLVDPRGIIGRAAFAKSVFFRSLVIAVIIKLLVSSIFYFVLGDKLAFDQPQRITYLGEIDYTIFLNSPPSIYKILFILPLEIMRFRDMKMHFGWIAPNYLLFLIPWEIFKGAPFTILLCWSIYSFYSLTLLGVCLFRPGQTFKEWVRAKDQPA